MPVSQTENPLYPLELVNQNIYRTDRLTLSLLVIDTLLTNEATSDQCMPRSSTKELFKSFENLEQEFCSYRKLFKTPSFDKSSSPEFDLFSDLEEHSEEEVARTMTETMEEYMTRSTETSDGLAAIQALLNNLGREIKKVNEKIHPIRRINPTEQTTLRNDALPRKEKGLGSFTLPCYINNVCYEKALAELGASVSVMPLSTYLNLGLGKLAHTKLTVELADRTVKHPKGIVENVLVGIDKRPFLSTDHAKIDVFKRKITLRVGDEKIIFKSVKPASSLIKRVYMLSLRERMDLDLKARLMGETLILNRSFDPLYGDYIELNDLNEPLELRRNRVDHLEPTVKEGDVVNEPMIDIVKTRCDFIGGLDDYPSNFNFDRRIHIDCILYRVDSDEFMRFKMIYDLL
ncbi:retrovirus-related pol polyprotein from transposon TNT 1-94 [Tanacetum coccineum]